MNKQEIMRVLLCLSRIEGKVAMNLDEYLGKELTEVVDMLADKILRWNKDVRLEGCEAPVELYNYKAGDIDDG